jgi:hypothetical protein
MHLGQPRLLHLETTSQLFDPVGQFRVRLDQRSHALQERAIVILLVPEKNPKRLWDPFRNGRPFPDVVQHRQNPLLPGRHWLGQEQRRLRRNQIERR